jgi:hypothetical protein
MWNFSMLEKKRFRSFEFFPDALPAVAFSLPLPEASGKP